MPDRPAPGPRDEEESSALAVPAVAYDAAGIQTVVLRVRTRTDAAAVAAGLPVPPLTDVYVLAGAADVVAVGRFTDREALNALLADLSTDPRVTNVTVGTVLRTACEHDTTGLVACERD